ncbi:hypothetical protein BH09MYX1_BH09MYX1_07160 [soil metagenome]
MRDGSVHIDRERFLAAHRRISATEYAGEVPASLAVMFSGMHDPAALDQTTSSTLRAARSAVAVAATTLEGDVHVPRVTVFAGDLHVKGDFTMDSHVLVLGDLVVDGVITVNGAHAIVMIAGDVRCRAAHLVRAYLFVTGDVTCEQSFFGGVHGFAKAGGTIHAKLYLHDDSWANLTMSDAGNAASSTTNIEARAIVDVGSKDARALLDALLLPLTSSTASSGAGDEELQALLTKIALGVTVLRD